VSLFNFALINLKRNKKTTITIGLLVFLGVSSLMFAYSFIKMSFYGLGEQMIHQSIGHFQIQDEREKNQKNEYPLEFGISNKDVHDIEQKLQKYDDDIRAIMPKLEFSGIISSEYKSDIFLAKGIEPQSESVFSSVFIHMLEGKNLGLDFDNPKKDEIIIGYKLAGMLSLKVGDIATIMVSSSDGALNAIDCVVSGIFSTGTEEIDKRLIMLPISLAKELMKSDKITKLSVGLYDTSKAKAISEDMKEQLKDTNYKVYFWQSLAPFYNKVVSLYLSFFYFLGGIIIFVVISSVFGSVSNMVSQKTKEIGMLKANGFSNQEIVYLVIIEVLILSSIASVSAFVFSHIGFFIVNNMGIYMPPPPGSNTGYPLAFISIYKEGAIICIVTIAVSLLSALKPSLQAGRLKIADALRS